MKEAYLWSSGENNKVKCNACSHRCSISEGKTGVCKVRKNIDGRLYSLVYEKAIAVNIDPIEKKPLYHFLPGTRSFSVGTVGCNFRCAFCQNFDIAQPAEIEGEDLKVEDIIKNAKYYGCESISYTYNEPVVFIEYVLDTAERAKEEGMKNVCVTNGYMTKECLEKLSKVIDAMNVDLKSFKDDFYRRHCGASLNPVKETIKSSYEKGIWIEVTTLIIPGENDSEDELRKIAEFIAGINKNIPWHVSRFFPYHKMKEHEATPYTTLEKAKRIGQEEGLNHIYIGNAPVDNTTYCHSCKKPVIERAMEARTSLKEGKCMYCNCEIGGVFENED